MTYFRGLGAASCLCLAATVVPVAEAGPPSLYLYPSAYYAVPDSGLHARDDYGVELTFGAQVTSQWAVEVLSETSNFKLDGHTATVAQRGVSFQALFTPFVDMSVAPFLSLGGGWLHTHAGGFHDDSPLARGSIGLQWLSEVYPIGVRADASIRHEIGNHATPTSTNSSDFIYSIGIEYRFGGSHGFHDPAKESQSMPQMSPGFIPAASLPEPMAPPPSTRTLKPATSVLDSDGDGVPDSVDKCPDTPPGAQADEDGCTLYLKPH